MRFKRVKMKEFTKHFNINKTNRVVGFTPDFVGSSKSKTVKAKNFLLEFISCNFNTISDSVSDSCKMIYMTLLIVLELSILQVLILAHLI